MNLSKEPTVAPKQIWRHRNTGNSARVMAVSEGYVLARYKGAMPWVRHWKDFELNFERVSP